jgi:hypothetical protein
LFETYIEENITDLRNERNSFVRFDKIRWREVNPTLGAEFYREGSGGDVIDRDAVY